MTFLEDRRVLYSPDSLEVPRHCVASVLEIRRYLTGELGQLDAGSDLAGTIRAMRAACRKFLDQVGTDGQNVVVQATQHSHWASWVFYGALGEMRGTFGVLIARIATQYKLDVEEELARILPANADDDEQKSDRRRCKTRRR